MKQDIWDTKGTYFEREREHWLSNPSTERFNTCTTAGSTKANDDAEFALDGESDCGVEEGMWRIGKATRIEFLESQIQFLEEQDAALIAEYKVWDAEKAPWNLYQQGDKLHIWISERIEMVQDQIADLERTLDNSFVEEIPDPDAFTKDFFPTHWVEAKAYWSRILDFVVQNPDKMTPKVCRRLLVKIMQAKAKKNISTYLYAMIRLNVAYILGNRETINTILQSLADTKLFYEKMGWTWKPETKEPVLCEIDTEEKIVASKYPWDHMEELLDKHFGWV